MSFTITNSSGSTVLTATSPISIAAGTYYLHACKCDSPIRKVQVDSSPGASGSFAQDFGDMCWPITGGSIMICATTEQACKQAFENYAGDIKQQIGLRLSIPNSLLTTYINCFNTSFELVRRGDGRIVIPNGNGTTFRCYVNMDFLQLSQ